MDCSVVIVNYHHDALLAECLESLAKASPGLSTEVIVVDNGGTLAPGGFRERFPAIHFVDNPENLGFARAANQGIRLARGRHVLCLNPDTVVHEGALHRLVAYLDAHPGVGVVGARLLESDGSLQYSCRRFPSYLTIFFGRYALLTRLFPRNRASRDYLYLDWDHRSAREVDWVSGACLMVRREVIARVGGFDEGYFLFVEDMDWCRRIRDAGFTVAYVPEAVVTHHIGVSRGPVPARVVWARHQGMRRYVGKHFGAPPLLRGLISAALLARAGVLVTGNALRRSVRANGGAGRGPGGAGGPDQSAPAPAQPGERGTGAAPPLPPKGGRGPGGAGGPE
jgi:N-acetylglucosaminyl-diphospho-decaprenol L-rhamnosyltransferase